ncbi:MAG: PDZ domain-containing protein [Polyangiaceae bacterium]|nr:PDZ domain-containing protein [Polyangiaceae bacterium]
MRTLHRVGAYAGTAIAFGLASWFSIKFGSGGLWRGLEPGSIAVAATKQPKGPYDLTKLSAVNETLKTIREKYVDPSRVRPREMLLSALNRIQQDVAQVIVLHDEGSPEVTVRVETAERKFRVDNVQGPWDVSAKLREVFAFLQENLRGTELDLREIEYAACNGMLHTLDPHSVFLSPEAYKEMNQSTAGKFGGLGIVISLRDQMLTVMSPMPGTPAGRAGLKRYDRIVKINSESTLNMPLDDAVRRLRGDPQSKVTIWVRREGEGGWAGDKKFELTREIISVRSVDPARLLDGGVGYVRLKQFQSKSVHEIEAALADFKTKEPNLKGLVLDLRGYPGGLLDQAVRIADLFLKRGVIVATVGAAEGREEKSAKAPGTEPDYPIVVLVSGNSASASEIVAGALKNLDRALIVGQTTFGKGSVQLVFNDVTPERAALKLTIAQYLTPGDESIQSVGIAPDIELDPVTVDEKEMDLYSRGKIVRERDLSSHLSNARAREGQKPAETVRYYLPEAERAALRERGGELDDSFEADFSIRLARELALKMPPGQGRKEQLRAVHDFLAGVQKDELAKAAADLSKMGVDWAEPPAGADVGPTAKDYEVKVETDRPGNEVRAGEAMKLSVTVKNNGKDPVYQLRAQTQADSGYYDGKELVFGKLLPGQSKTATVPVGFCDVEGRKPGSTAPTPKDAPRVCRIPKDAVSRQDGVRIKFESAGDHAPAEVEVRPTIRALDRPMFAYAYEVVDNRGAANGDGRVQKGEGVTLYLKVRNVGKGRSHETQANLRNLSGDSVLLGEGRFDISNMQPGDTRRVAFTFDVQPAVEGAELKLELSVADRDLREIATEKLKLLIEPAAPVTPLSGGAKARDAGALLVESPSAAPRPFGKLAAGTVAKVLGRSGEFLKIELGKARFGFVKEADVELGAPAPAEPAAFEDLLQRSPPLVEVAPAALATRDGKIKIVGFASDSDRILDAYMFVNARKVFYRSNKGGADPTRLPIDLEVPLRPGTNYLRFVARETPETVTQRVFVVRRDGAHGELLATPKTEEALFDDLSGD